VSVRRPRLACSAGDLGWVRSGMPVRCQNSVATTPPVTCDRRSAGCVGDDSPRAGLASHQDDEQAVPALAPGGR